MGKEQQVYQPTHDTQISLDEYRGVASDIMSVNPPVADGFMRVSDLRRNIVVVQRAEQRVVNYDQVGPVKTGKILNIPIFERTPASSEISYDEDSWFISVDDQTLARRSSEETGKGSKKFDEVFTAQFQKEINARIKQLLLREKIIAQGDDPGLTFYGYLPIAIIPAAILTDPEVMPALLEKPGNLLAALALVYGFSSITNISSTIVTESFSYLLDKLDSDRKRPRHFNHPFIRKGAKGFLQAPLPSIPVDRLIRGRLYLAQHGKEIISTPNTT